MGQFFLGNQIFLVYESGCKPQEIPGISGLDLFFCFLHFYLAKLSQYLAPKCIKLSLCLHSFNVDLGEWAGLCSTCRSCSLG